MFSQVLIYFEHFKNSDGAFFNAKNLPVVYIAPVAPGYDGVHSTGFWCT
jgi:hypothetical protein